MRAQRWCPERTPSPVACARGGGTLEEREGKGGRRPQEPRTGRLGIAPWIEVLNPRVEVGDPLLLRILGLRNDGGKRVTFRPGDPLRRTAAAGGRGALGVTRSIICFEKNSVEITSKAHFADNNPPPPPPVEGEGSRGRKERLQANVEQDGGLGPLMPPPRGGTTGKGNDLPAGSGVEGRGRRVGGTGGPHPGGSCSPTAAGTAGTASRIAWVYESE